MPRRAAAAGQPRHAGDAARLPRGAAGLPARARGRAGARGRRPGSTSTRCARSTPTTAARARVMAGAPRLLDRLADDDREHFEAVRALLDGGGPGLRGRRDARARPRLLHAHRVRVHLGRARRAVGRRRRRALRRPDRADRRAADAGHRLGGRRRADADDGDRAARGRRRRSTCSSPTPGPSTAAAAFRLAADARRAGQAATLELGGRSLKGQLRQADRAGARYVAILGDEGVALKDMETGEQRDVEADTVIHHITQPGL